MADAVENLGFVFSATDLASGVVTKAEENVEAATKAAEVHVEDLAESAEKATQSMGTATDTVATTIEAGFNQTNMILRSLTMALTSSVTEVKKVARDAAGAMGEFDTETMRASKSARRMKKESEGLFGQLNFVRGALGQIIKIGGVGAIFGAGMEAGKRTLGFVWDTLKDTIGPGIEVLQNAFKTTLAPLTEEFYKLSVKLAPMLSEALTPIVDIVTNLIPLVGDFVSGLSEGGGVISTVFGAIKKLWDGLKEPLGRIISSLTDLAEKVLPIILRVVNMILETAIIPILTKAVDIISKLVEKLVPIMVAGFERLEPLLGVIIGAIFRVADTFLDTLEPAIMPIIDLFAKMAEDQAPLIQELVEIFVELVDALLPIVPPLVKIVGLLLKMSIETQAKYMMWMVKAWLQIAKVLMVVIDPLAKVVGWLAEILAIGLEEWMTIIKDAWAGLADILERAWGILKGVVKAIWDFIGPPIIRAFTIYINIWKMIYKIVKALVVPIFEKVVGIVKNMLSFWKEVGKVVVGVWKSVKDAAWNAITWAWTTLESGFKKVKDFFFGVVDTIKTSFVKAMDWIKEKIMSLLELVGLKSVGKMAGKFIDTIKGLVTAPVETIKDLINSTIIDTINSLLRWKVPVIGGTLGGNLGLGSLSYLQEGGIVTEPTATTLVERGIPEMVLPLEKTYIQRFMASVLPLMAPVEMGPMKVETDLELKDLLKQAVGQLGKIVNLLSRDERVRPPALEGGF